MKWGGTFILLLLTNCSANYNLANFDNKYYSVSPQGIKKLPAKEYIDSKELINNVLISNNS